MCKLFKTFNVDSNNYITVIETLKYNVLIIKNNIVKQAWAQKKIQIF